MKAILIDAVNKKVLDINIEPGLAAMYKSIGCKTITSAFVLPNADTCFVDDEGLLGEKKPFFMFKGYGQPLAGNGVILGSSMDGDSIDAKTEAKDIVGHITFVEFDQLKGEL